MTLCLATLAEHTQLPLYCWPYKNPPIHVVANKYAIRFANKLAEQCNCLKCVEFGLDWSSICRYFSLGQSRHILPISVINICISINMTWIQYRNNYSNNLPGVQEISLGIQYQVTICITMKITVCIRHGEWTMN